MSVTRSTFASGSITSTGPNPLMVSQVQSLLTRFELWADRVEFIPESPGSPAYDVVDHHLRLNSDGSGSCVVQFAKRLYGNPSDADLIDARIFQTKMFALSFNNLAELDRVLKTVTKLFSGGTTDGGFEFEAE